MRLSKIKLAGFKSFVDPTTINFPGNLTGIVGPNGCGKSNTIDAVRWVMGESSAKHLRGASMDDVIFNGSSARKPVGMASVELVFDNSDGKLGGQYANYAEISVKRTVTRDGASKYSLNGTRCRRRDVADLFLGTGLGPRSYAIIEQGMISRLIEAKPEEMRTFLEEAAGISKYKERRKETETRIRHTRENLDRLSDLREEIEKQLARLQRQSRSAERYKEYKQEERRLKAEHLLLQWRELKRKLDQRDQEIQATGTRLEKVVAEQRAIESRIEQTRQEHTDSNDALNRIQGEFYRLGAEISAKEQHIRHQKELAQRQKTDLDRISAALDEASRAIDTDSQTLADVNRCLESDAPALQTMQQQEEALGRQLHDSEQRMQNWQQGWDEINQRYSQASQRAQVERSRMEQLERHVQQLKQRLDKIEIEKQALKGENLEEQIADLQGLLDKAAAEKSEFSQMLGETLERIREQRESIVAKEQQASEVRRKVHQLQGSLSSLEALQQAALGKTDASLQQWLERAGLAGNARLAQQLKVDPGWELAVETVLGDTLEAVCVDRLDSVSENLQGEVRDLLGSSSLTLLETGGESSAGASSAAEWLLSKVEAAPALHSLLQGIRVASTLSEALAMRTQLHGNESVITPEGVWLGPDWLRISGEDDARAGVLAREQSIRELQQQLGDLETSAEQTTQELAALREALQGSEQQREELQERLNAVHARLNEIQAQISARQSRQEHIVNRSRNLQEEQAETENQIRQEEAAITEATRARNESLAQAEAMEGERKALQTQRDSLNQTLQEHRVAVQQQREKAHQLAIRIEGLRTQKTSLEQNLQRMKQARADQQQRKQELESVLATTNEPTGVLEEELKALLETRLQSEQQLNDARRQVDALTHKLRELEQQRSTAEQTGQEIRNRLEQKRLDSQALRVRSETALEQLTETGFSADEIASSLPAQANCQEWEQKLADIARRITRLGPINLAAIDEYKEQLERKEYLDEQNRDVEAALEILEKAIAKIDGETRSRFKETYDHVNARIKDMFPRLFGGGTAHLEMTGDDLLSTGVAIMARPPGKRISNIHLMSGGEKALTAVALVFAIFELNPAPFCMLDEVDAPLDEANVGRFCQLVKEMSSRVQFIFITHNKTTMEISEHLSGVTMRESGVSRLVSVDVAEAATMAGVGA